MDNDIFLKLAEKRNEYVNDCKMTAEKEWGKIEGADYMLSQMINLKREMEGENEKM